MQNTHVRGTEPLRTVHKPFVRSTEPLRTVLEIHVRRTSIHRTGRKRDVPFQMPISASERASYAGRSSWAAPLSRGAGIPVDLRDERGMGFPKLPKARPSAGGHFRGGSSIVEKPKKADQWTKR